MYVIDPHIHMIARPTSDYERMARMHCVACCEPAFWAGYDRTNPQAFHDYFTHITSFEPARAAKYGIQHYAWIGMNAKEANDVEFSKAVTAYLPEFLPKPTVLGIGEIGLNKNTPNEMKIFELQVDFAVRHRQMILIHTPHLSDKRKGVRLMLASLRQWGKLDPAKVMFDHLEEHVVAEVLDAGYWAGLTLYPLTKNTPPRAVDTIERYGVERICVDTSGDWGPSDPGLLHDAIFEMRRRGHPEARIETVFYDNPCYFLGQCPKFRLKPTKARQKAWAMRRR